jgi:tetratricopeptide (TPR) repeat protein
MPVVPLNSDEEAKRLYKRAFGLVEVRRFAEARPVLEECLQLNPGLQVGIPARQELARVLYELGDRDGSLRLRFAVKALAPDRHANFWKLAQLLAELGRPDEALAEAERADRIEPRPHYRQLVEHLCGVVGQPARDRTPVGYVFLSWTTGTPRDNAATQAIIRALTAYDIGFFDYTKYPVDSSTDRSPEIDANLNTHVAKSDCSIEIVTCEIIMRQGGEVSDWVRRERDLLCEHGRPRLFACLDMQYLFAEAHEGEDKIIRMNMSDGRMGFRGDEPDEFRDDSYYRSLAFAEKCLRLARLLRAALLSGDWRHLRGANEFTRKPE